MARSLLCIHPDSATLSALVADAATDTDRIHGARSLTAAAAAHGGRPAEVVLTQLDEDADVVRSLLRWYPRPAVVTIGAADAVDLTLANGASDHVQPGCSVQELRRAVDRSWRRHRAARTGHARLPAEPGLPELRDRVNQAIALTSAARDLLDVEQPPHPTTRSLLDQAALVGRGAVDLTTGASPEEPRVRVDLAAMLRAVWRGGHDLPLEVEVPHVEVHGRVGMLCTAMHVLVDHTLRAPTATSRVIADVELAPWAIRLRVHDDGPTVTPAARHALFVGGDPAHDPTLLTVQHVAARHGGAAWIADSDRLPEGTMCVLELPRRSRHR